MTWFGPPETVAMTQWGRIHIIDIYSPNSRTMVKSPEVVSGRGECNSGPAARGFKEKLNPLAVVFGGVDA